MFDFIKGRIALMREGSVVVENNGIGFQFSVSANCLKRMGESGSEALIYAYLAVKDDGVNLYGFFSRAEKDMFLRLIGISGIGPKAAIAILGGLTPDQLAVCIAAGDVAALSSVKGIGKKTAERIVLELKDKLSGEFDAVAPAAAGGLFDDAVAALVALGFNKNEAAAAVKRIDYEGMPLEQIVMQSLKRT